MPAAGTDRPHVVVIGGANVDVKARSTARAVPATSNPGTTSLSAGGVGRNVAENLARLGASVHLVAAVGRDQLGDQLLADTDAAGVEIGAVVRTDRPTGTYTAVLDSDGELVTAVADMGATDLLGTEDVRRVSPLVAAADLLVLDGNLSVAALQAALELAADAHVPVALDPVSVPKARRLRELIDRALPLFLVTPNAAELDALGGDVDHLHARGVEHVWVRLGSAGSRLSTRNAGAQPLSPVPAPVADVTGAGDAMLAAFCHGVLSGRSPVEAARLGHAAAALTVASPHTVRPDLSLDLVEQVSSARSTT